MLQDLISSPDPVFVTVARAAFGTLSLDESFVDLLAGNVGFDSQSLPALGSGNIQAHFVPLQQSWPCASKTQRRAPDTLIKSE